MTYDLTMRHPAEPEPDYDRTMGEAAWEARRAWLERYTRSFNIVTMGLIREEYLDGVLDREATAGAWPDEPDAAEDSPGYAAYEAAEEAFRAQRSPHPGRVPAFKFRSNDAWIVTPDECRTIAAHLRAVVPGAEEDWRDLLLRFAAFNERAAAHGGYEVS